MSKEVLAEDTGSDEGIAELLGLEIAEAERAPDETPAPAVVPDTPPVETTPYVTETQPPATPPAETVTEKVPVVKPEETAAPSAKVVEPPAAVETPAVAEVDELTSLREQNKTLSAELARISGTLLNQAKAAASPKDEPAGAPVLKFFASDDQIEPTAECLNGFGSAVVQVALAAVPTVVSGIVRGEFQRFSAVQEFKSEYADLKDFMPYVAAVTTELQAQNPGAGPLEIYRQAGDKVRALLKSPAGKALATTAEAQKATVAAPAVAPQRPPVSVSRPVARPAVSELEAEMSAVFNS